MVLYDPPKKKLLIIFNDPWDGFRFFGVNSCMGHLKRSGWEPTDSTLLCGHEESQSDGKEPSPSPLGAVLLT